MERHVLVTAAAQTATVLLTPKQAETLSIKHVSLSIKQNYFDQYTFT